MGCAPMQAPAPRKGPGVAGAALRTAARAGGAAGWRDGVSLSCGARWRRPIGRCCTTGCHSSIGRCCVLGDPGLAAARASPRLFGRFQRSREQAPWLPQVRARASMAVWPGERIAAAGGASRRWQHVRAVSRLARGPQARRQSAPASPPLPCPARRQEQGRQGRQGGQEELLQEGAPGGAAAACRRRRPGGRPAERRGPAGSPSTLAAANMHGGQLHARQRKPDCAERLRCRRMPVPTLARCRRLPAPPQTKKPRYSVVFHRPKTLVRSRDPKFPRVRCEACNRACWFCAGVPSHLVACGCRQQLELGSSGGWRGGWACTARMAAQRLRSDSTPELGTPATSSDGRPLANWGWGSCGTHVGGG